MNFDLKYWAKYFDRKIDLSDPDNRINLNNSIFYLVEALQEIKTGFKTYNQDILIKALIARDYWAISNFFDSPYWSFNLDEEEINYLIGYVFYGYNHKLFNFNQLNEIISDEIKEEFERYFQYDLLMN